jgi:hypothetical protein
MRCTVLSQQVKWQTQHASTFRVLYSSFPCLAYISKEKRGNFWIFSFYVRFSTLLHLPPLRFHCDRGFWHRTQDFWYFTVRRSNHLARSHPLLGYRSHSQLGYRSHPQLGYRSNPQLSYRSHPQLGYRSYPQLGYRSHPQHGYRSHPQLG